ncbi:MAG: hypothetical protein Q8O89_06285 [Nanoarchaeota archaeon]|nr:hypothetical protein [Nanoarchaeota archaeon]
MAKVGKKAKDLPLVDLTFRKYEKPEGNITKRELVKKLCLSVGLLQPGDSRDVVVDILYVLLQARKTKRELSSEEIKHLVVELRTLEKLPQFGIANSNIRRQLKRIRDVYFIEKIKNKYRITEQSTLLHAFEDKLMRYLLPSTMDRIKEYINEVDDKF